MVKYKLINYKTSEEYIVDAKDKRELRIKAFEQIPEGTYKVINRDGSLKYSLNIDKKRYDNAKKARPFLPKDQYDQLYYYIVGRAQRAVDIDRKDPLQFASRKRYDTIQEVRKAAIAKSKALWKDILETHPPFRPMEPTSTVFVYKGRNYLGFVEYNILKGKDGGIHNYFDATWHPKEHPKDPSLLLADGSIGSRPIKRRK